MCDFFCKLKKLDLKGSDVGAAKIFYIPELDKKDAAVIAIGHHICHDGITQMQCYNSISDNEGYGPSPFMKVKTPSILQWTMIYLTAPFTWYFALKHYMGTKADRNCIKKHSIYMSGNFSCHNSKVVSVQKTKELTKKMGVTWNDFILGLTSKVLKTYFV